jgi:hypothetical protein
VTARPFPTALVATIENVYAVVGRRPPMTHCVPDVVHALPPGEEVAV